MPLKMAWILKMVQIFLKKSENGPNFKNGLHFENGMNFKNGPNFENG
jgi:hypothetical protein